MANGIKINFNSPQSVASFSETETMPSISNKWQLVALAIVGLVVVCLGFFLYLKNRARVEGGKRLTHRLKPSQKPDSRESEKPITSPNQSQKGPLAHKKTVNDPSVRPLAMERVNRAPKIKDPVRPLAMERVNRAPKIKDPVRPLAMERVNRAPKIKDPVRPLAMERVNRAPKIKDPVRPLAMERVNLAPKIMDALQVHNLRRVDLPVLPPVEREVLFSHHCPPLPKRPPPSRPVSISTASPLNATSAAPNVAFSFSPVPTNVDNSASPAPIQPLSASPAPIQPLVEVRPQEPLKSSSSAPDLSSPPSSAQPSANELALQSHTPSSATSSLWGAMSGAGYAVYEAGARVMRHGQAAARTLGTQIAGGTVSDTLAPGEERERIEKSKDPYVAILNSKGMINGGVISGIFDRWSARYGNKISLVQNFMYNPCDSRLRKPDENVEMILIPIVLKGGWGGILPNHVVAMVFDKKKNRVELYDSQAVLSENQNRLAMNIDQIHLTDIIKKVKETFGNDKTTVWENHELVQHDSHNCGMYVLDYFERRLAGQEPDNIAANRMQFAQANNQRRLDFIRMLLPEAAEHKANIRDRIVEKTE